MSSTKILIVEDEILVAREIEDILQELGYQVVAIAQDGEEALQQVAETLPDLVLMDIVMPGAWDGIDTANQIRTRFQIPIVYLTAYADAATLERAKISEPFGYVLKPFQPPTLHTTIQIALTRSNIERIRLAPLRSDLTAHLPQEMDTPLCVILSSVDLLIRCQETLSNTEVLEMLQGIYTAAQRLDHLCNNFWLHTELEILTKHPNLPHLLAQNKINSTLDLIKAWSENKATELNRFADLQLGLQDSPAQISTGYLKKIVDELLDNALRYSKPGASIQINSALVDSWFCLSIRDHGKGMTPEQVAHPGVYLNRIWEEGEEKGLGIGLSLIRRLVELHNGHLTIESTLGEGTTVTVELPSSHELESDPIH